VPLAKRLISSEPVSTAWVREQCVPHIFGQLPGKTAEQLPGETTETQQAKNVDAPT
jgi:xanthosine utilization system XapX-like protein